MTACEWGHNDAYTNKEEEPSGLQNNHSETKQKYIRPLNGFKSFPEKLTFQEHTAIGDSFCSEQTH